MGVLDKPNSSKFSHSWYLPLQESADTIIGSRVHGHLWSPMSQLKERYKMKDFLARFRTKHGLAQPADTTVYVASTTNPSSIMSIHEIFHGLWEN
jgi:hypothetical protein